MGQIERKELECGVVVTLFDNGAVKIETPPAAQGETWLSIILSDRELFNVMAWAAGLKMPGDRSH